jgi:integrase
VGDVAIPDITRDRLKDFVVKLTTKNAEKRSRTEEGQAKEADRKLSKDSIRNIVAVAALRSSLTEAVDRGFLQSNPAANLGKLHREAGQIREEVDPFTADEIPVLLATTMQIYGFMNYAALLTLFHTGLRSSELAGLKWSDVDFRNRLGKQ